jgi:hypothetical protein
MRKSERCSARKGNDRSGREVKSKREKEKKKNRSKEMDSFGCEESTTRLFASLLRPASPRLARRPCVESERWWCVGDADDALTSIVGRLKIGHVLI